MKPVKLGHGKVGGGKAEGGGMAAQLLHEQQLRILASLYGAPLRCVGVPPTSGPADLFGLGGVAKRMPAGGGRCSEGGARRRLARRQRGSGRRARCSSLSCQGGNRTSRQPVSYVC